MWPTPLSAGSALAGRSGGAKSWTRHGYRSTLPAVGMSAGEWTPEFPGQRPPFAEGNDLAVKHGAKSPRKVEPVAQALAVELLADSAVEYLRAPRYAAAVQAWATAEAKCALISAWLDGMPIERAAESKQGQTSPLELLRKWEATAQTHRSRLGWIL